MIPNTNSKVINKLQGKIICTDYILERPIGKGSYGFVYKGVQQSTGDSVAIKAITNIFYIECRQYPSLQLLKFQNWPTQFPTKLQLYKLLVVPMSLNFMLTKKQIQITISSWNIVKVAICIAKYANKGNVNSIFSIFKVDERTALEYLCQILNGYKAMHQSGVMHRDIKLENIMLKNQQLKIVDFGFAKIFRPSQIQQSTTETVLGSPVYMGMTHFFVFFLQKAPELLEQKPYGIKAEVYSLGVLLYWMVFGKPPYVYKNLMNPDDFELAMQIKVGKAQFTALNVKISKQFVDLLHGMLQYDVKKRFSFKQIFDSQLLANLWKINKDRGDGMLGMPMNLKDITFDIQEPEKEQQEEEEKQTQQVPRKPRIKLIMEDQAVESIDKSLIQEISNQEFRRLKAASEDKLMLSEAQYTFIMANYETELRYLIFQVSRINFLQQSKICFVKDYYQNRTRSLSLAYMIKQVYVGFYSMVDALMNNKNIYENDNFDSLVQFEPYQIFKEQIISNYYPIIRDYDKYEIGGIVEEMVTANELSKEDQQILLMEDKDFNPNYYLLLNQRAKEVIIQHYKEVQVYVEGLKNTHYQTEQLQEFYRVQLEVLVLWDIKKYFPTFQEIKQFEINYEKMLENKKWQKMLKEYFKEKQRKIQM